MTAMNTPPDNNGTPEAYATAANPPDKDTGHVWIGAAQVNLDDRTARRAARYQSYIVPADTRVHVLDVYCEACRRNLEDVKDEPCAAQIDNTHLIGGDQAHRMKRKIPALPAGAVVVPGPRINRRGIDAVIRGEL